MLRTLWLSLDDRRKKEATYEESPAIIYQSGPIGSVRFRRYQPVDREPKMGDARRAVVFDRNGSEESVPRQLDGGSHLRHRVGHGSGLRGIRIDG